MTTRTMGPGAGLDWLKRGINLGRNHPRAIFGGVALLALVALLPSVLQMVMQQFVGQGASAMMTIIAATSLLSLVLMPPMIGGYLRIIEASEHNTPASASMVFAPFRSRHDMLRLVGFGLLMTAIYLGVAYLVVLLLSPGLPAWYSQILTLSQQGQPADPSAMPALPDGFGSVMGLGSLLAIFLGGVYAIGFGQIALSDRGVVAALGDGVIGTLKNLLPLLVLALLSFVLMILAVMVFGVIALVLGVVGALVHPLLGVALALPVYLAMLLVLYVVMFGVMYHMWRDVAGEGDKPSVMIPGRVEL